jgi:pimeloyl-ACP methyl ester carboxylesterase
MVYPDRAGTPLFEEVLDRCERGCAAQYAAQINALRKRPDATLLLPAIQCPTLALTGREDSWRGPAQHEAMATAIPARNLSSWSAAAVCAPWSSRRRCVRCWRAGCGVDYPLLCA